MTERQVAERLDREVYRLHVGDKIRIEVFGEPDLSIEATIDEAGLINYPLLGRKQASGHTVQQLEDLITEGLRDDYLVSPAVRVTIAQFRPIFVLGEVRSSGAHPYAAGLTVEKAIALAGGLTELASRRRIYLLRDMSPHEGRVRVDLDALVAPGDTIIVEEGWF